MCWNRLLLSELRMVWTSAELANARTCPIIAVFTDPFRSSPMLVDFV